MNPSVWGPKLWFSLHSITLNYPKKPSFKDQKTYNNFFVSLQHILPCKNCAGNYKKHLDKFPITENLGCRKDIVLWLINIHNEVNKTLGKPEMKPSVALKLISKEYNACEIKNSIINSVKKNNLFYIFIVIGVIGVIILIYFIANKKKQNIKTYPPVVSRSIILQQGGGSRIRHSVKTPSVRGVSYYGNRF